MVTMNLKVNDYTSRVLGVVKEKYGLKDKSAAADKFASMFGGEFIEPEVKDEVIQEFIDSCDRHIKKYGFRKRRKEDLEKLFKGD